MSGERLEQVTVFTPLGIRFWDPVMDVPVRDGLTVTARPEGGRRAVGAFQSASGIYAFQGLPGMRSIEYPEADVEPASPPVVKPFLIEVTDGLRRFLPILFSLDLPLEARGVYPLLEPGSPPDESAPGFLLFSAPTRPVVPGIAVVRADLVDEVTGGPAAYAVLEVAVAGQTWYGVADERGTVAVHFPYPIISGTVGESPPGPPSPPLREQRWPVTLAVRYQPASIWFPRPGQPELRSIFRQTPGSIWETAGGPPAPELSKELVFAQELVLRTESLTTLLVSRGASPP